MLLFSLTSYTQVGIGTEMPESSSILDLHSENKGFLMPRLTTDQRDLIVEPAKGLMIFNTTINDGQLNIGMPNSPIWVGIHETIEPINYSISLGDTIHTVSTTKSVVSGMSMAPSLGTYLVTFNAQVLAPESFSSEQGVEAVNVIYTELMATSGSVFHDLIFGNEEVLSPGVYEVTGAGSIAGTLTLDGNNEINPLFIIKISEALTTGAHTTVNLVNGADAKNIFWVSEGAISTADSTVMKGTLVSNNEAVSLGANTHLEGRLFSTTGALSMGENSTIIPPSGHSNIDLGVLASFSMFTASGAISGCATCSVNGDVGTGLGAATDFDSISGTVYPAGTEAIDSEVFYSIFKEGEEVQYSSRTIKLPNSLVSLQSVVSVLEGETIEIRWAVDDGEVLISHRILNLIRL